MDDEALRTLENFVVMVYNRSSAAEGLDDCKVERVCSLRSCIAADQVQMKICLLPLMQILLLWSDLHSTLQLQVRGLEVL